MLNDVINQSINQSIIYLYRTMIIDIPGSELSSLLAADVVTAAGNTSATTVKMIIIRNAAHMSS